MTLNDFISKLADHGVSFRMATGSFKPKIAVLTKDDLLCNFKIYSDNITLSEPHLVLIGKALNLPNNWWNKTP